jgi:LysR family transcriptional regulator, regulator for bpeEF and oprC
VLPRLHEFETRYPDIELVLGLSDRPSDLIYEGIDCAIRTGALADSTLVARRLGQLSWLTCASPRYLRRYGEPDSVAAPGAHKVINYISNATGRPLEWRFSVEGEDVSMTMRSRFSVNETEAYVQCGLEGLGLIQLSEFAVSPFLRKKERRSHIDREQVVEVFDGRLFDRRCAGDARIGNEYVEAAADDRARPSRE